MTSTRHRGKRPHLLPPSHGLPWSWKAPRPRQKSEAWRLGECQSLRRGEGPSPGQGPGSPRMQPPVPTCPQGFGANGASLEKAKCDAKGAAVPLHALGLHWWGLPESLPSSCRAVGVPDTQGKCVSHLGTCPWTWGIHVCSWLMPSWPDFACTRAWIPGQEIWEKSLEHLC